MMAVEAVKEKFYCFLGIVHPTYYPKAKIILVHLDLNKLGKLSISIQLKATLISP